jgi:hypothetical protein
MSDEELCLTQMYEKMIKNLNGKTEISPEIVGKLLLRVRMMFDCRGQILRIL